MKSRKDFIENDEYVESELSLKETTICKTQKRLYVTRKTKRKKSEKIVNLNTVQGVTLEEGREKRTSTPLLMGLIFAGASAFFATKDNLKPVFYALLFIGAMLTLIGIIVKLPRYYSRLVLLCSGAEVEFTFEKISGAKEEKLKKMMYSTLIEKSNTAYVTQVQMAPVAVEPPIEYTEIPVVTPVEPTPQAQEEPVAQEKPQVQEEAQETAAV